MCKDPHLAELVSETDGQSVVRRSMTFRRLSFDPELEKNVLKTDLVARNMLLWEAACMHFYHDRLMLMPNQKTQSFLSLSKCKILKRRLRFFGVIHDDPSYWKSYYNAECVIHSIIFSNNGSPQVGDTVCLGIGYDEMSLYDKKSKKLLLSLNWRLVYAMENLLKEDVIIFKVLHKFVETKKLVLRPIIIESSFQNYIYSIRSHIFQLRGHHLLEQKPLPTDCKVMVVSPKASSDQLVSAVKQPVVTCSNLAWSDVPLLVNEDISPALPDGDDDLACWKTLVTMATHDPKNNSAGALNTSHGGLHNKSEDGSLPGVTADVKGTYLSDDEVSLPDFNLSKPTESECSTAGKTTCHQNRKTITNTNDPAGLTKSYPERKFQKHGTKVCDSITQCLPCANERATSVPDLDSHQPQGSCSKIKELNSRRDLTDKMQEILKQREQNTISEAGGRHFREQNSTGSSSRHPLMRKLTPEATVSNHSLLNVRPRPVSAMQHLSSSKSCSKDSFLSSSDSFLSSSVSLSQDCCNRVSDEAYLASRSEMSDDYTSSSIAHHQRAQEKSETFLVNCPMTDSTSNLDTWSLASVTPEDIVCSSAEPETCHNVDQELELGSSAHLSTDCLLKDAASINTFQEQTAASRSEVKLQSSNGQDTVPTEARNGSIFSFISSGYSEIKLPSAASPLAAKQKGHVLEADEANLWSPEESERYKPSEAANSSPSLNSCISHKRQSHTKKPKNRSRKSKRQKTKTSNNVTQRDGKTKIDFIQMMCGEERKTELLAPYHQGQQEQVKYLPLMQLSSQGQNYEGKSIPTNSLSQVSVEKQDSGEIILTRNSIDSEIGDLDNVPTFIFQKSEGENSEILTHGVPASEITPESQQQVSSTVSFW